MRCRSAKQCSRTFEQLRCSSVVRSSVLNSRYTLLQQRERRFNPAVCMYQLGWQCFAAQGAADSMQLTGVCS
jgi:hypothetical protein